MAVSQGHTSIIELLVTRGADINVKDEDGDTCLHVALMRQSVPQEREATPMLEAVSTNIKIENAWVNVFCILMDFNFFQRPQAVFEMHVNPKIFFLGGRDEVHIFHTEITFCQYPD